MKAPATAVALFLFAVASHASLVTLPSGSSEILIPVAGAAAGANGTFFRSDINVVNFSSSARRVQLFWLPQGASGSSIAPIEIDVAAASGFSSEDFVTTIMGQTGLGAILIRGVTSNGAFDPTAQLYATARIWTPGAGGTVSQSFFTIATPQQAASSRKWIFGVRRDSRYRMNAGIANASDLAQRFRITTIAGGAPADVVEVDLLPMSMQQLAVTGAATGSFQVVVENITAGTRTNSWQAWASSIDNVTGDAWSMMAFPAPTQSEP